MQSQLKSRQQTIIQYENSGNEEKAEKLTSDYEKLAERRKAHDIKQKTLTADKSSLERQIYNQDSEKRNLEDNIKLRNYLKCEAQCAENIAKYVDELDNLDYKNNERRRVELSEQADRLGHNFYILSLNPLSDCSIIVTV